MWLEQALIPNVTIQVANGPNSRLNPIDRVGNILECSRSERAPASPWWPRDIEALSWYICAPDESGRASWVITGSSVFGQGPGYRAPHLDALSLVRSAPVCSLTRYKYVLLHRLLLPAKSLLREMPIMDPQADWAFSSGAKLLPQRA